MDVLRRNTDYAMRLAATLAKNYGNRPISARQLAETCDVSYELTCKLLQRLAAKKIVKSTMGANGGFELAEKPENFNIYQIVSVVQDGICLSCCVPQPQKCLGAQKCKIRKKLIALQEYIDEYLKNIKLDEIQ